MCNACICTVSYFILQLVVQHNLNDYVINWFHCFTCIASSLPRVPGEQTHTHARAHTIKNPSVFLPLLPSLLSSPFFSSSSVIPLLHVQNQSQCRSQKTPTCVSWGSLQLGKLLHIIIPHVTLSCPGVCCPPPIYLMQIMRNAYHYSRCVYPCSGLWLHPLHHLLWTLDMAEVSLCMYV